MTIEKSENSVEDLHVYFSHLDEEKFELYAKALENGEGNIIILRDGDAYAAIIVSILDSHILAAFEFMIEGLDFEVMREKLIEHAKQNNCDIFRMTVNRMVTAKLCEKDARFKLVYGEVEAKV